MLLISNWKEEEYLLGEYKFQNNLDVNDHHLFKSGDVYYLLIDKLVTFTLVIAKDNEIDSSITIRKKALIKGTPQQTVERLLRKLHAC